MGKREVIETESGVAVHTSFHDRKLKYPPHICRDRYGVRTSALMPLSHEVIDRHSGISSQKRARSCTYYVP